MIDHSRVAGDTAGGLPPEETSAAMRAAYRIATLAIGAIGVVVCWQGRQLVYYTPYGPGPAFFPLWLGGLLIVLALGLFVGSFIRRPSLPGTLTPPPGARLDLVATLAAILAFTLLIERLGFALTVFPMVGGLLLVRRCSLPVAIGVAAVASFGVGYVFSNHLGVALPRAPRDLLLPLGL
jgi:putative tricarboxylic transport membrane protein